MKNSNSSPALRVSLKMSPYRKLVRSLRPEFKWRKETLALNKIQLERRLELTLRRAAMCARHAKRNTIMVQDFELQQQMESTTREVSAALRETLSGLLPSALHVVPEVAV